jgi:hypothetical protein
MKIFARVCFQNMKDMEAVTNIVDPYVGLCWEAGPVPDNYVPHSEDKALDCIPHGENKVQ